jgi:hypothetical protein
MLAYLSIVRQWAYYGSTFFKARYIPAEAVYFKQEFEGKVRIGVNENGLHVIDPRKMVSNAEETKRTLRYIIVDFFFPPLPPLENRNHRLWSNCHVGFHQGQVLVSILAQGQRWRPSVAAPAVGVLQSQRRGLDVSLHVGSGRVGERLDVRLV